MHARTTFLKPSGAAGAAVPVLVIAAAVFLSSCLPAPHGAYYRPSSPDGSATLSRRDCGGYSGPPSVITVPVHDVLLSVHLAQGRQDSMKVVMSLEAPKDSLLQFASDEIRLTDLDRNETRTLHAGPWYLGYWHFGQIPSSKPVDFTHRLPTAPENILNDMEVSLPFSFPGFSPDVVRVHLPPVASDSGDIRIPPLVWNADREGASVEGYKKGWDWWPYIEEDVTAGRMTVRSGATCGVDRGLKAEHGLQAPGLHGNILIAFPADMAWRFSSDEIVFEDAGSGESRRMRFTHLQDRSSPDVAFAAEFRCAGSGRSSTFFSMPVELPQKIRIELPPLLINGRKYDIQPITFELRRFEFGVYPFNC